MATSPSNKEFHFATDRNPSFDVMMHPLLLLAKVMDNDLKKNFVEQSDVTLSAPRYRRFLSVFGLFRLQKICTVLKVKYLFFPSRFERRDYTSICSTGSLYSFWPFGDHLEMMTPFRWR